jgi:hypothetical protein
MYETQSFTPFPGHGRISSLFLREPKIFSISTHDFNKYQKGGVASENSSYNGEGKMSSRYCIINLYVHHFSFIFMSLSFDRMFT